MKYANVSSATSKRRSILSLAALFALISCGGGGKTYELYGNTESTLRNAPTTIDSQAGKVQLIASANEFSYAIDVGSLKVDPQTGQPTWSASNTSSTKRTLYAGVVLGKPKLSGSGFDLPATEWTPRTLWIFQGSTFISTRELQVRNGVAIATFEESPLTKSVATTATVEYVSNGTSTYISGPVVWLQ